MIRFLSDDDRFCFGFFQRMFQFVIFRLRIPNDVKSKSGERANLQFALVRLKPLLHTIFLFGDDRHILLESSKLLLYSLLFRWRMAGFTFTRRFIALKDRRSSVRSIGQGSRYLFGHRCLIVICRRRFFNCGCGCRCA